MRALNSHRWMSQSARHRRAQNCSVIQIFSPRLFPVHSMTMRAFLKSWNGTRPQMIQRTKPMTCTRSWARSWKRNSSCRCRSSSRAQRLSTKLRSFQSASDRRKLHASSIGRESFTTYRQSSILWEFGENSEILEWAEPNFTTHWSWKTNWTSLNPCRASQRMVWMRTRKIQQSDLPDDSTEMWHGKPWKRRKVKKCNQMRSRCCKIYFGTLSCSKLRTSASTWCSFGAIKARVESSWMKIPLARPKTLSRRYMIKSKRERSQEPTS